MRPFIYVLISPIKVTLSDVNKSGQNRISIVSVEIIRSARRRHNTEVAVVVRIRRTQMRNLRHITC